MASLLNGVVDGMSIWRFCVRGTGKGVVSFYALSWLALFSFIWKYVLLKKFRFKN